MFATGSAVFLALLLIMAKLPRRWLLRLLHYDIALNIGVTLLVMFLHWCGFDGVIAATVRGLMTSFATSAAACRGGVSARLVASPSSDQPTASLMHFFRNEVLAAPASFFSAAAALQVGPPGPLPLWPRTGTESRRGA